MKTHKYSVVHTLQTRKPMIPLFTTARVCTAMPIRLHIPTISRFADRVSTQGIKNEAPGLNAVHRTS